MGRTSGRSSRTSAVVSSGAYTELLEESRNEAIARMVADAQARGANAIVNVRFATSAVTAGASELFAYGTAVMVE